MAANIMEMLRQIQRDLADQKDYMRNLHVINRDLKEKLNLMDERTTDLPKVLVAINRLEQQVKKNNMILYGNDETEIISEGTIMPYKSHIDDEEKAEFLGRISENSTENTEVTELYPSKVKLKEELNGNDESKNDDHIETPEFTTDELGEIISKEMHETKQPIRILNCPFCKQDAAEKFTTYINSDQTQKLEDILNRITDLYQSDMKDLRQSMKHLEATIKMFTEEAVSTVRQQETIQNTPTYFTTEQISQINAVLKRITDSNQSQTEEVKKLINDNARNVSQEQIDKLIATCTKLKSNAETNQSEMRQMQELMKYFVAKKLPIEASTASKQKTVQISPTYFSPDQMSKLNSGLKRVAEIYQGTDMFPVIQVVPGAADEHPVMKQLREGVFYTLRVDCENEGKYFKVKLGTNGLKRTSVIDMITDYPNLTVNDVVKEWLISIKKWNTWSQAYWFNWPMGYNKVTGRLRALEVGQ
ncbi:uncharacterized protein LOC134748953 [Cydia strobilella]|uniref:uncharacterized protein LOC134748953 n=1 Tax=Cydia strobilella TaxID=1100964 RepID=UPI003007D3BF